MHNFSNLEVDGLQHLKSTMGFIRVYFFPQSSSARFGKGDWMTA